MAKATGPLFSVSASGKLADSLVYFGWKGINVVRQWLKPANPMAPTQGDRRIMIGGTGRAVGRICPRSGSVVVSAFAKQLIDLSLLPGGQTKQSFLVKYILDQYITGITSYTAELTAVFQHTASLAFGSMATALSIVDFDLDYAVVGPYDRKLGLYLIAKAAIALGFLGTADDANTTQWPTVDVNGMCNDFTSAT